MLRKPGSTLSPIIALAFAALSLRAFGAESPTGSAEEFLAAFVAAKGDALEKLLSTSGRQRYGGGTLESASQKLGAALGKPIGTEMGDVRREGEFSLVRAFLRYAESPVEVGLVLDGRGGVECLLIHPGTPLSKEDATFSLKDVRTINPDLGSAGAPPAWLVWPERRGPCPTVVAVADSEAVATDTAKALLPKGVASMVLRRRSPHAPREAGADFTVDREILQDIRAAIRFIRRDAAGWNIPLDPSKVSVLGIGAASYFLPRLCDVEPAFRTVLLCPPQPGRPESVLRWLTCAPWARGPKGKAVELPPLPAGDGWTSLLEKGPGDGTEPLPLGLPRSYWDDLRNYDARAAAAKFGGSVLVLPGQQDPDVGPAWAALFTIPGSSPAVDAATDWMPQCPTSPGAVVANQGFEGGLRTPLAPPPFLLDRIARWCRGEEGGRSEGGAAIYRKLGLPCDETVLRRSRELFRDGDPIQIPKVTPDGPFGPGGVYIPRDLEDCFRELDRMLGAEWKREFQKMNEADAGAEYHMGLGMWMRNNWGLWAGSRLAVHFNAMGVYHPDDMSSLIIACYHRKMNGKPLRIEKQVKEFKEYWKKRGEESPSGADRKVGVKLMPQPVDP